MKEIFKTISFVGEYDQEHFISIADGYEEIELFTKAGNEKCTKMYLSKEIWEVYKKEIDSMFDFIHEQKGDD